MWSGLLHSTNFAGFGSQKTIMRQCLFGFPSKTMQFGVIPAWRFPKPRITALTSRFANFGHPMTDRSHSSGPIDAAMATVLALALSSAALLALILDASAARAEAGGPAGVGSNRG